MDTTGGRRRRPDAEAARRRRAVLGDLLEHVGRRREAAIAWDAVPTLATVFADDDDVLRDLGGMWSRALAGQVDAVLDEHDDLRDVVEDAAARLAAARPALHAVLAAYAERPVVRAAAHRDAARLGVPTARAHAGHVRPRFARSRDVGAPAGDERVVPKAAAGRRACCWRWLRPDRPARNTA